MILLLNYTSVSKQVESLVLLTKLVRSIGHCNVTRTISP